MAFSITRLGRMLPGPVQWRVKQVISDIRVTREVQRAFRDRANPPILVLTMGKVGTRTVAETLRNTVPNPVLILHHLGFDLDEQQKEDRAAGLRPLPAHWAVAKAVRKTLQSRRDVPCKVISLVRDPVATILSMYFHTPQHALLEGGNITNDDGSVHPDRALSFLTKQLNLGRPNKLVYIEKWFDRDVKEPLNIDVLQLPFDRDAGYTLYNQGSPIECMVIRLENLNDEGPRALAQFFDLQTAPTLSKANLRENMTNNEAYEYVKQNLCLDRNAGERIYASHFARHFYRPGEIERFTAQWTGS